MYSKCPDCGSSNISRNERESYCNSCGKVLEDEKIDSSEEYRIHDESDKDRKRAEGKVTFTRDDKGFGSKVGNSGDLGNMSGSRRGQYYRMMRWNDRTSNRGDRDILIAVKNIVSTLSLPEHVAEEAGRLALKAREADLVQGRSTRIIAASIIYLVARNNGVPRTVDETAEAIGVDETRLSRNYRYVAREMDLGIKPVNPKNLLPRFANELGLNGEFQAEIRDIIDEAKEKHFTVGRKPASVVSGAIYYVASRDERDITQREISKGCGVTTVTIRDVSQDFRENLGEEKKEVSVKNV